MTCSRWTPALGLAVTALLVAGCSGIKSDLGLTKTPPDEFAVVKRPPLSMPPDFTLRPPSPGARGPQYAEMREQAREALIGAPSDSAYPTSAPASASFGSQDSLSGSGYAVANSAGMSDSLGSAPPTSVPSAPRPARTRGVTSGTGHSLGEMALLEQAGVDEANPEIRRLVNQESAQIAADEESLVNRLMFWVDRPPPGEVVDAARESQRLRENAALGRAPTEGATPTIERKAQGRGISIF